MAKKKKLTKAERKEARLRKGKQWLLTYTGSPKKMNKHYRERLAEMYEDYDDRFAFIAGYTDGGAPFGVMWEEVGIDPGLPFEEKVKLYHMQMLG